MPIQDRALYRLLRKNRLQDPSIVVEPWQVEDLRVLRAEELFSRLERVHIILDAERLKLYAEELETPEELIDCLWLGGEQKERDQTYLILFELWRRLLPEKESLSIFCDRLDQLIEEYDAGNSIEEEDLIEILKDLEDVLDLFVDEGLAPKEAFQRVLEYSAHDLEGFLYDYITDEIERKNELSASHLLDGFYDYMEEKEWFDFLRARIFYLTNPKEAHFMLRRLFESLVEKKELPLLLEMASFFVPLEDFGFFMEITEASLPLISSEEEFQDFLFILHDYYTCLDKEETAKSVEMIQKEKGIHKEAVYKILRRVNSR